MPDDVSRLNETERMVLAELKKHLGSRATVKKVAQELDRIVVHVVSPNDFSWTAGELERVGPPLAAKTEHGLDINLTTSWIVRKNNDQVPDELIISSNA
jgi:hypothetical protein